MRSMGRSSLRETGAVRGTMSGVATFDVLDLSSPWRVRAGSRCGSLSISRVRVLTRASLRKGSGRMRRRVRLGRRRGGS